MVMFVKLRGWLAYMESFQPGLSFIPVFRAEISARPKDKILLKHRKQLHDQNSSPVWAARAEISARAETQPGSI